MLGRVNTQGHESLSLSGKDEEGHIRLGEAFSLFQVFVRIFWFFSFADKGARDFFKGIR